MTTSRDKRSFLEENHFDLHGDECLTKGKEDPSLFVLAWEPVVRLMRMFT
jgi:hypothetical protein